MDKKSIVNDLYQAAVISVLAVGYSMLGKKILLGYVKARVLEHFSKKDVSRP